MGEGHVARVQHGKGVPSRAEVSEVAWRRRESWLALDALSKALRASSWHTAEPGSGWRAELPPTCPPRAQRPRIGPFPGQPCPQQLDFRKPVS